MVALETVRVDAGGYKRSGTEKQCYTVALNVPLNTLYVRADESPVKQFGIWFETVEDAMDSIGNHEAEWRLILDAKKKSKGETDD